LRWWWRIDSKFCRSGNKFTPSVLWLTFVFH
jgi:hypothetical protein